MTIFDEAGKLSAAGRKEEAVALVQRAADQGDAEAMFAVGNWRLFGLFGPRDVDAAHRLFDASAAKGYVEAIRTKAILIANGTGVTADAARAEALLQLIRDVDEHAALQLDFARDMPLADIITPGRIDNISDDPVIRSCPAFLSQRECAYLMGMAQPHMRPSFVTHPSTGRQMPHPIRNSTGMSFGPTQEDLVVRRINERIAALIETDVGCGEPLHILRYTPGQEYKPHTDGMPGEANQRIWTVLIYLNEGYDGGATSFSRLGIDFRGAAGDALIFYNVDAFGAPNMATLHAGLPVTQGEKWLATRWVRARVYHPWDH